MYPDLETLERFFFRHEKNSTNIEILKEILGTDFDCINNIKINSKIRHDILNEILDYFKIHLGDFKKPNSLRTLGIFVLLITQNGLCLTPLSYLLTLFLNSSSTSCAQTGLTFDDIFALGIANG